MQSLFVPYHLSH